MDLLGLYSCSCSRQRIILPTDGPRFGDKNSDGATAAFAHDASLPCWWTTWNGFYTNTLHSLIMPSHRYMYLFRYLFMDGWQPDSKRVEQVHVLMID